jgi:hypothetical protein
MKKNKWFTVILGILFICFLGLYIAYRSGYYEAKVSRKAIITEEKIKEFEQDVKDGKDINIKDYVNDTHYDYSSPMSRLGNSIATKIDKIMGGGVSDFFNFLGMLFT